MKRGEPLQRRTRLKADPDKTRAWTDRSRKALPLKSAKRAAARPHERAVTDAVFARDGGCVLRTVPGHRCWGPLTPHHLRKQSAGGEWTEANVVALCAGANSGVEDDPPTARKMGLVVRPGISHADALDRRRRHGLVV